jgi:virginiamycin B lyase
VNNEPFDDYLSWELRTLVEDADPPPSLRPATVVRTRALPRPFIVMGSVAAAIVVMVSLLVSGGSSGPNRQHVASEGKDHTTTSAEEGSVTEGGVVLPSGQSGPGATPTTLANGRSSPPTAAKKGATSPTTKVNGFNGNGSRAGAPQPPSGLSPTPYSLPANTGPWSVVTGPDGNLWSAGWPNNVLRITPSGQVTSFNVPPTGDQTSTGCRTAITVGPDKNLWFTTRGCASIGRITTAGVITLFDVPLYSGNGYITAGGDGALWFDTAGAPYTGAVGRLTTDGKFTKFNVGCCTGLTTGADGNVWFGARDPNSSGPVIRRITPTGAVTEFPSPDQPSAMTLGPDGNVWYFAIGAVGRITPAGDIKGYSVRLTDGPPVSITTGPDGNLWAVGYPPVDTNYQVARVTPSGTVTMYEFPTHPLNLTGITAGPDGNLWVSDLSSKLWKLPPPKS